MSFTTEGPGRNHKLIGLSSFYLSPLETKDNKKKTKESFYLATRSFIGDEGEPSGHEGRLEEVCLVHDNAADLCLGI